ncbi:MAG: glycogen synthase, partial [Spirochaetales bacterium]|nr:glycogen synthase [Spirochaetales bacterium]
DGTGFKFIEPDRKSIYEIINSALGIYFNKKPHFKKFIQNAMKQNFSWEKSAKEYERLYLKAIKNHC